MRCVGSPIYPGEGGRRLLRRRLSWRSLYAASGTSTLELLCFRGNQLRPHCFFVFVIESMAEVYSNIPSIRSDFYDSSSSAKSSEIDSCVAYVLRTVSHPVERVYHMPVKLYFKK